MLNNPQTPYCATCPVLEGSIVADCPAEILEAISDLKGFRVVGEDDCLFAQATPVDGVFCQYVGRFALLRSDSRGEEHLVTVTRPGAGLGAADLLQTRQHSHSAVALEDSAACYFPAELIESLISRHPAILVRVMQSLCTNLADIEERLQRQEHIA